MDFKIHNGFTIGISIKKEQFKCKLCFEHFLKFSVVFLLSHLTKNIDLITAILVPITEILNMIYLMFFLHRKNPFAHMKMPLICQKIYVISQKASKSPELSINN